MCHFATPGGVEIRALRAKIFILPTAPAYAGIIGLRLGQFCVFFVFSEDN